MLEARGLKLDKRHVHLEEPIKNVGTYMVVVEVSDGVTRRSRRSSAQRRDPGPSAAVAPHKPSFSRAHPVA
jgi:hypothetical protein